MPKSGEAEPLPKPKIAKPVVMPTMPKPVALPEDKPELPALPKSAGDKPVLPVMRTSSSDNPKLPTLPKLAGDKPALPALPALPTSAGDKPELPALPKPALAGLPTSAAAVGPAPVPEVAEAPEPKKGFFGNLIFQKEKRRPSWFECRTARGRPGCAQAHPPADARPRWFGRGCAQARFAGLPCRRAIQTGIASLASHVSKRSCQRNGTGDVEK